jgi:hypothetical protein
MVNISLTRSVTVLHAILLLSQRRYGSFDSENGEKNRRLKNLISQRGADGAGQD